MSEQVRYQRVVVGVDGRQSGWSALEWAAGEAVRHRCGLVVVHCWTPRRVTGPPGGTVLPAYVDLDRPGHAAQQVMAEAMPRARRVLGDLPLSGQLRPDDPVPALLAQAHPDDLLVVGARTRHRLAARLLGSTIASLVERAPCALAVLPATEPVPPGAFAGHVLIGVDDSPGATAATRLGFAEAVAANAPVAVVHAYLSEHTGSVIDEDTLETHLVPYPPGHALLQAAIEPYRHDGPHIRRACLTGDPATVLAEATAGARLLVLGRHHRPWPLRPVTRLSDTVLAHAHCPVLLTAPVPLHVGTPPVHQRSGRTP
ncbi:nucleotide-binding universal stress UspA family protein [Crossiella equi]|uniref:Nucleotide-binding universal stress UspA family protein n=1 Tax=Crossiella equi TaxID=130796 RepID=A0ABS5A6K9_9PSEU|nr:universal stress protein [Crossiella equi]MBP2471849.1 nucleotide-binding universal stress UspA family protein [Crossiella equi]